MNETNNNDSNPAPFGPEWGKTCDPNMLKNWVVDGRYRITQYLGGGGFGDVYKAINENLPTQSVVLKFLKRVQSQDRFENEAKLLSELDHPNICRIIDFLPEERALVMPFINGKDLEEMLQGPNKLDEDTLFNIINGITSAISFAHKKNIAHRDIKPKNIMIDHNNHVYLIDFGIAKEIGATSLTGTGRPPYTPQYAAPERHRMEGNYNPFLSDVYEIGSTILKLTTGQTPFDAMHGINPAINKKLDPKLLKVLKKSTMLMPSDRYVSVDEFIRTLSSVKRIYRRPRAVFYVGSIAVVAIMAFLLYQANIHNTIYEYLLSLRGNNNPDVRSVIIADTLKAETTNQQSDNRSITPPVVDSVKPNPMAIDSSKMVTEFKPKPKAEMPGKNITENDIKKEPPKYTMDIMVDPITNTTILINGKDMKSLNSNKYDRGEYSIEIINPNYPVYMDTIKLKGNVDRKYDLPYLFNYTDSVGLTITTTFDIPHSDILVKINNKNYRYGIKEFPIIGFKCLSGSWIFNTDLILGDGTIYPVDSLIVLPFGSSDMSFNYGSTDLIDFRNLTRQSGKDAFLIRIYFDESKYSVQ